MLFPAFSLAADDEPDLQLTQHDLRLILGDDKVQSLGDVKWRYNFVSHLPRYLRSLRLLDWKGPSRKREMGFYRTQNRLMTEYIALKSLLAL